MAKLGFVTGANGFLGVNLVKELLEAGWDVVALHREGSNIEFLKRLPARRVVRSIEDRASLRAAMPERVDAVFHVAANVTFWRPKHAEQTRTNVEGTRNVVAVALERGAGRLIHTSSMAVYGFQPGGAYDESAPKLGQASGINYFETKTRAEDEVRSGIARGLDGVILNPSNIGGPFDTLNWARMFLLAEQGKLPGAPPGRASFCHVTEVARAHRMAFERGRTGENYLLGGADARYLDVFALVARSLGKRASRRAIPRPILKAAAWVADAVSRVTHREPVITPELAELLSREQVCDSTRAMKELDYQPTSLEKMFEDARLWLVEEKLLKPF